jgi:hypothetical protein
MIKIALTAICLAGYAVVGAAAPMPPTSGKALMQSTANVIPVVGACKQGYHYGYCNFRGGRKGRGCCRD